MHQNWESTEHKWIICSSQVDPIDSKPTCLNHQGTWEIHIDTWLYHTGSMIAGLWMGKSRLPQGWLNVCYTLNRLLWLLGKESVERWHSTVPMKHLERGTLTCLEEFLACGPKDLVADSSRLLIRACDEYKPTYNSKPITAPSARVGSHTKMRSEERWVCSWFTGMSNIPQNFCPWSRDRLWLRGGLN